MSETPAERRPWAQAWLPGIFAVTGLAMTIVGRFSMPEVAVSLAAGPGPGRLIPVEHGLPLWGLGLGIFGSAVAALATIASRRFEALVNRHAVGSAAVAALFWLLVVWGSWIP